MPAGRLPVLRAALGVTAAACLLYALTACRTIYVGDSAELAAAAALFGVPHPPGYPLYTMVTGTLVRALPLSDAAFEANLASALYGALAVGLTFWLVARWGCGRLAALTAAASLATGTTFWSASTAAEVYSFDAALLLAALHVLTSARRSPGRWLWPLAGLVVGLWLGHRPVNAIYLPAVLVVLSGLTSVRATLGHRSLYLGIVASGIVYGYLPLASSRDPALDIGDPQTWSRFWVVVRGAPYLRHFGAAHGVAGTRIADFALGLPRELGVGGLLAGVAAVSMLGAGGARRRMAAGLLAIAATGALFGAIYGVLDISSYYLPAFASLALLSAFGAEVVLARFGSATARAALVACALLPTAIHYRSNDLSRHHFARALAESSLATAAPDGVLVVEGDTTIHGLWFLQSVEHRAEDVIIVSPGHLFPWYVEQLAKRFPDETWPPLDPGTPQLRYARRIVDALIDHRPVYFAPSVDVSSFTPGAGGVRRLGTLPKGLLLQAYPTGTGVDVRKRAALNARLLNAAMRDLEPIPREVDMDTKSIFVQYALGGLRNGQLFEKMGRHDLAIAAYRRALSLDPDRHQRDIEEDVRRGLGRDIPKLRIGEAARRGIDRARRAAK